MTISIIDLPELESDKLRQLVHGLQQQITLALDESVELRLTDVKSVLIGRLSMCSCKNRNPACTPSQLVQVSGLVLVVGRGLWSVPLALELVWLAGSVRYVPANSASFQALLGFEASPRDHGVCSW